MISIETIEARASELIERALSDKDPVHYQPVFLDWAMSLYLLLSSEGDTKGAKRRRGCGTGSSTRGKSAFVDRPQVTRAAPGKLWPQRTQSSASDTFFTVKARQRGQKLKSHRKIRMDKKGFCDCK